MCGIVGYLGQRDVVPILLGGLPLGQIHHADQDRRKALARALSSVPEKMEHILALNDQIRAIAEQYADHNNALYLELF